MKNTKQKDAILAAVLKLKFHPSADDVYKYVKNIFPNISLGTVYRNLNTFAKLGYINKICIPNSSDRFDYDIKKHEHFLCKKCGSLLDADVNVLITNNLTFEAINDYSLIIHGVCEKCNKNEEE